MCSQALGIDPVEDPAFEMFDAPQRLALIRNYYDLLRRANPLRFDRCVAGSQASCDSVAREIPEDVIPRPTAPDVRQSVVSLALEIGGDGAFDRFVAAGSPKSRIEAASRLPADSVVGLWRTAFLDTRHQSTAIDAETALSAVAWAALCGALALRSSRWR